MPTENNTSTSGYVFSNPLQALREAAGQRWNVDANGKPVGALVRPTDTEKAFSAFLAKSIVDAVEWEDVSETSIMEEILQDVAGRFNLVVMKDNARNYYAWRDDAPNWPFFDNKQAINEDWVIAISPDCENGPIQLQRIDEGITFEADEEAMVFVKMQAMNGSKYHQDAIAFIKEHNPLEYAAIELAYNDPSCEDVRPRKVHPSN